MSIPQKPAVIEPGGRIEADERSVYVVDEVLAKTPWRRVLAGRKVFYNFRHEDRGLYEAGEDEWLQVVIHTLPAGRDRPDQSALDAGAPADDTSDRSVLHRMLYYEMAEVLRRHRGWFPAPVDWVGPEAGGPARSQKSEVRGHESLTNRESEDRRSRIEDHDGRHSPLTAHHSPPLLVVSKPQGETLSERVRSRPLEPGEALRAAVELLELLESLHAAGQVFAGLGPDDVLVEATGRLCVAASERVLPAAQWQRLRPLFPPERLPGEFAPPEAVQPDGELDARSDLFSWSRLAIFLLTGGSATARREADFDSSTREAVREIVDRAARTDPPALFALAPADLHGSPTKMADALVEDLFRCGSADTRLRPASLATSRGEKVRSAAGFSLSRLWRRLRAGKRDQS